MDCVAKQKHTRQHMEGNRGFQFSDAKKTTGIYPGSLETIKGCDVKSMFGTVFVATAIFYLLYTLSATEPCERVSRSASPVRVVMQVFRLGVENWADKSQQSDFFIWSLQADMAAQKFLAHQFYGETLVCGKSAKKS
jgi:hypothetical protein